MTNKPLENSFVAVGDIMLGDSAICVGFGFHSRYRDNIRPAFANVEQVLKQGEVVFGNLECLLTRVGRGRTRLSTDQMRGEPTYAQTLRSLGFTALGLANNHAMQHGIRGFEETVESLKGAGIACVGLRGTDGWCAAPVVQVTRAGLRVGLLGYSWRPRQYDYSTPPYAEGDVIAVEQDVKRLGKLVDTVIVSLHWGEEFLESPSSGEVDAARRIIDAGATAIIGHHPHVFRPVAQRARGVICYSLGNFVTDMIWQSELRGGGIFECRLEAGAVLQSRLSRTRIDDSYAPVVEAVESHFQEEPAGIPAGEYRIAAAHSVSRQRRAAYRYALRNAHRYPFTVFAELGAVTLSNKVASLVARVIRPRHAAPIADASARPGVHSAAALSILHIAAPAQFGGLESVVRELAAGQARRGHAVRVALVLSPGSSSHPLAAALEANGVTVLPLRVGDRDYRGERRAVRALCQRYRPDIVHTHGYRCDVVDGVVARNEGIPIISTCHGFIESRWRGRLSQWLQRRMLRKYDAVVAVSRAIEHRLLDAGIAAAKIHLVPNAAVVASETLSREEARRVLDLPSTPVVGWVGRLSAEKGPDVALEAFARLNHRDARLLLIGSGRDEPELRARATALGIGDRVFFRGAIPNAGRLLCAFDAFLISSRTEGTPIALLEAMAAGTPIVATRVGGVPDVIDSQSARLVESGDVEGLAAALADVLANPDASRQRADHARKRLDDGFAVEPWLSAYESIYRRCVAESKNR